MSIQHCTDQNEQQIRDRWVLVSVVSAQISTLTSYLTLPPSRDTVLFLIIVTVLGWIWLWGLFHCTYRKRSWRFLTFVMNLKILGLVAIPFLTLARVSEQGPIVDFCINAIDLFLVLAWLHISFRLRKINARAWRQPAVPKGISEKNSSLATSQ